MRQFAENAADFVTDANAHGKNTRDVLGAAYANAAVQAAIEKVGLDKVLTPGGKTVARRMVKSALAEGGEEAAQQLTENAFAKHTYDPSRNIQKGLLKAPLWVQRLVVQLVRVTLAAYDRQVIIHQRQ
ncbi:hypothetical protein GWK74_02730 [Candidatus Saccharibacteria bacterium oral taxon 488]|nr:hypothetical protein GWK74_02730 [Candidatus Saccharibacteria bacterium oral taxon 488]